MTGPPFIYIKLRAFNQPKCVYDSLLTASRLYDNVQVMLPQTREDMESSCLEKSGIKLEKGGK